MQTECNRICLDARVEGRAVVAGFDGGTITSDAGDCCWGRRIGRSGWSSALPAAFATAGRRS